MEGKISKNIEKTSLRNKKEKQVDIHYNRETWGKIKRDLQRRKLRIRSF